MNGAHFKYEDEESNDYVSINFKNNEIKLYDNGDIEDNITNKEFESHILAIEKAYHYEVDEYEDFNNLRF